MKLYSQNEIFGMLPSLIFYDVDIIKRDTFNMVNAFRRISWDDLQTLCETGYFNGYIIVNLAKGLDNHICITIAEEVEQDV